MKYRPDDYDMKMGFFPELPALQAEIAETTMTISGNDRSFFYYIPKDLPPGAPLVFILHGSFDTGDIMRMATGAKWDQLADRDKFIAVYPNAYAGKWNDGRLKKSKEIVDLNIQEEPFFLSMVAFFAAEYLIDRQKIGWFGHSGGGHAIYRISHTQPDIVSAAVVSCANIPAENNRSIKFADPPVLPIMLVHGTEDPIAVFDGGSPELAMVADLLGPGLSAGESVQYWLAASTVRSSPEIELVPNAKHNCIVEKFLWKRTGYPEIQHYVVHGGGHVMPNISFDFPELLGRTNRDVCIFEEGWNFLKRNM